MQRLEAEICSSPPFPAFRLPPVSHPAAILLRSGLAAGLALDGALGYLLVKEGEGRAREEINDKQSDSYLVWWRFLLPRSPGVNMVMLVTRFLLSETFSPSSPARLLVLVT